MVLVGASEAYTGLAIAEQSAWNTVNSTDNEFARVLLVSETLTQDVTQLERNAEFGDAGAQTEVEFGRKITNGDISWRPRYDDPATHLLFGHFFGDEKLALDQWVTGLSTGTSTTNTHMYGPTASITKGLTGRAFRGGPSASGYYAQYVGLIPTRLVFDQAENRPLVCTTSVLGKPPTVVNTSPLPPAILGKELVKFGDLSRVSATPAGGQFKLGETDWTGSGQPKMRRFRLSLSRSIEFAGPFLTEIQPGDAPIKINRNEMEVEFEFALEQIALATAEWHPLYQHRNRLPGQLDIRWVSASLTADTKNRALRIHFPKIEWTRVEDSLQGPGLVVVRATGTAVKGAVTTAAGIDETGTTVRNFGDPSDVRCFITSSHADVTAWLSRYGRSGTDKTYSNTLPNKVT